MGLSQQSRERLSTVDTDLCEIVQSVAQDYDLVVTCGQRGETEQHAAFVSGHSQKDWPDGPHNGNPSRAVDIYLEPVDLNDVECTKKRCDFLAGIMFERAKRLGRKIRWGGDWNNGPIVNQKFEDLPHFEIVKE